MMSAPAREQRRRPLVPLVFRPQMGMVVTIFLALAAATCSYSIGQGGPVAGLIFFTVLLIGAIIRIAAPKPE